MTIWKIVLYSGSCLAIGSAILLDRVYHAYESSHSSSRGFILLVPFILAPVLVGLLIGIMLTLVCHWKALNVGERILGILACLPMIATWLRFVPQF